MQYCWRTGNQGKVPCGNLSFLKNRVFPAVHSSTLPLAKHVLYVYKLFHETLEVVFESLHWLNGYFPEVSILKDKHQEVMKDPTAKMIITCHLGKECITAVVELWFRSQVLFHFSTPPQASVSCEITAWLSPVQTQGFVSSSSVSSCFLSPTHLWGLPAPAGLSEVAKPQRTVLRVSWNADCRAHLRVCEWSGLDRPETLHQQQTVPRLQPPLDLT